MPSPCWRRSIIRRSPVELTAWFRALLDAAGGPVVIYNIPLTTHVSIPLDVIGALVDHPRLVALKDSENDPKRHEELLRRFGGRTDFSIFIGVGALMAQGLKSGADGIVPSVGNLIPKDCQQQVAAARRQDWAAVDALAARQAEVAAGVSKGSHARAIARRAERPAPPSRASVPRTSFRRCCRCRRLNSRRCAVNWQN